MSDADEIRRSFAHAWGQIGAAWGVAPSTASVHGYLLAHGGPLTEAEVRAALGMSHRAALLALAECAAWGLVERAPEPRRSGRRGPAATAWLPVGDHWEWFRRVAGARKERETDPVRPVLTRCLQQATEAAEAAPDDTELGELRSRLAGLTAFVAAFDAGVSAVVRTESGALAHLFAVLERLPSATTERLLGLLAAIPAEELASGLETLSRLPPPVARRLLQMTGNRPLARRLEIRRRRSTDGE